MDFFIPGTRDAADAESVYAYICNVVRQETGNLPTNKKVRSIEFREGCFRLSATVGLQFEYETVSCIVETRDSYWIYTLNRGLRRGEPTKVDKANVLKVEKFAPSRVAVAASQHSIRGRVG